MKALIMPILISPEAAGAAGATGAVVAAGAAGAGATAGAPQADISMLATINSETSTKIFLVIFKSLLIKICMDNSFTAETILFGISTK